MDHNIKEMEDYASKYNIPIMEHDGIEFLLDYIKKHNVKSILEIGTAIGYSSIRMALIDTDINVVTIERDEKRYSEALKNIKNADLENQITPILDDAFNVQLFEKFDLIFIDAAKAQYIKFFEKFKHNLKDDGVIISDNLHFHGLTYGNQEGLSRNVKGIVRKLNLYIDFLKNNEEFDTVFIELGDGIGISTRK